MGATNHTSKAIEPYILAVDRCDNIDGLWALFGDFVESYGADLISYHHIPPPIASDRQNFVVMSKGHDEDWVSNYRDNELFKIDPIAQSSAHTLVPFYWMGIEQRVTLTAEQKDFMQQLRAWLKGDGLAIPAFGPSARNGYFGVGCRAVAPSWSHDDELRIFWAAQAFHLRYSVLRMAGLGLDFTLTKKETQILQYLAGSLSIPTIATLVGSREDTVNIAVRRIMKKMGVTDTASAVLRGISCNLISG